MDLDLLREKKNHVQLRIFQPVKIMAQNKRFYSDTGNKLQRVYNVEIQQKQ